MEIRMEFQKNEIVTTKIEDIGSEGEGIGRVEGFTLFVKDAVVGDTVEARILKSKKNYAYARLEKVIEPSPFRVQPRCAYHRQCGGCQLQPLSYEKQLEFKQEKIRNNLIHIGGFAPETVDKIMEPIIGMEEPFRYRNKAQYPVGTDREGNIITGFYAGRTHSIIPYTGCFLGPEENQQILECILEYMRRNKVSAYNEAAGTGLVRHVLIRKGFASGEIMVCLVINLGEDVGSRSGWHGKGAGTGSGRYGKGTGTGSGRHGKGTGTGSGRYGKGTGTESGRGNYLPGQDELISGLAQIKGMASISVSINRERTNVIMGKEIHTIWGSASISDTIHVRDMGRAGYPVTGEKLTFHISPLSFYQVNPVQTEKLYSLALEYASLTGRETVWDLYCGIGTISLFLARSAQRVYGVEIVPQAVEDARENARRNGIANAEFFVGKAEELVPEFGRKSCGAGRKDDCVGQGDGRVGRDDSSEGWEDGSAGGNTQGLKLLPPDVIVVDPPRKGCDEACLNAMLEMQPKRIVYVSCDPATLARDLKRLCEGGYEMERVRGVDQFGMTVHVEAAVLLCRADT